MEVNGDWLTSGASLKWTLDELQFLALLHWLHFTALDLYPVTLVLGHFPFLTFRKGHSVSSSPLTLCKCNSFPCCCWWRPHLPRDSLSNFTVQDRWTWKGATFSCTYQGANCEDFVVLSNLATAKCENWRCQTERCYFFPAIVWFILFSISALSSISVEAGSVSV